MLNARSTAHGRIAILLTFALFPIVCPQVRSAQPTTKPISTDNTQVGILLRKWAAEGAAAGNIGDWYDNRDGGHSMLDVRPTPQLQVIQYSAEDIAARRHWALRAAVLQHVVFGNSSTSAPPSASGSNPRSAYCQRGGLEILARQYRANNLYIYPEHRDHDPDDDPDGGFGDLFPTNTPYVIISQGSSGSDQPFMRAVPQTLAAFRPDVKRLLVEKGLLMPALQMIFRSANKNVAVPQDYLTGKAHPTVFEGANVNALKMIQLAHEITADRIPPLAQVRLIETETFRAGRDYFDPFDSEIHAQTPELIAHIFRAGKQTRRLLVSAENSFDISKRPLTYHWVVLRGDPARIRVKPLNESRSRVEITLAWHDRFPVGGTGQLMSSRIDIGLFVHNGAFYSPPAFVTSYCIPSEARTYDKDGKLLEIGYGHGQPRLSVRDWSALFDAIAADPLPPPLKLVLANLIPAQLQELRKFGQQYKDAAARAQDAQKLRTDAEAAAKKENRPELQAAAKSARDRANAAMKFRDDLLLRKLTGTSVSIKDVVRIRINDLARDPELFLRHRDAFTPLPKESLAALDRLVKSGVIRESDEKRFALVPLLPGDAPESQRLSLYQKSRLIAFHADLLSRGVPGIAAERLSQFITDFRIARPKDWRDVYAYTPAGQLIGWKRYAAQQPFDFTADGFLVIERDARGRCALAAPVQYQLVQPGEKRQPWDWPPVRFAPTDRRVKYEYSSDDDLIGKPNLSAATTAPIAPRYVP